jgi:hypothetical protein
MKTRFQKVCEKKVKTTSKEDGDFEWVFEKYL